MEQVKEFIELLITQTEDMREQYKNISEYIEGKIDAFKLVKSYIERKIEIDKK